jgi:hypothetical protein
MLPPANRAQGRARRRGDLEMDMRDPQEIARNKMLIVFESGEDGFRGELLFTGTKPLRFICSWGEGWEHVSISLPKRCPTWDEMNYVKGVFWRDDEVVMQLHPAKANYVNNHPFCLHLWRPLNATIPTPPSIMVGV